MFSRFRRDEEEFIIKMWHSHLSWYLWWLERLLGEQQGGGIYCLLLLVMLHAGLGLADNS